MPINIPSRIDIVDSLDQQATVGCVANFVGSSNNTILQVTTKNALNAWLAFVGMAWDAAGEPGHVTWRVLANGIFLPSNKLISSTVQIAAPEAPQNELVPWILLPQNTILTFQADIDSTPTPATINVTARFKIYYAPIDVPQLRFR